MMINKRLCTLTPDLVTEDLLKKNCEIFNANFQKSMNGKEVRIFPSRVKKYLIDSKMFCVYIGDLLVGYMIVEEINKKMIWVKQIVVSKEYRNIGIATSLMKKLIDYDYIGVITNNPIIVKILKKLKYKVIQKEEAYSSLSENLSFKRIIDLYSIEKITQRDKSYLALTNLTNTQKIVGNIDCSPLVSINEGYEWITLFEK